jgi:outer membrane protein assembly factor BamA
LFWFGGNNDMRGYPYLSFNGNQGFYGAAELRFPIIDAMLTPAGLFGAVRGTFFFNVGGASYVNEGFSLLSSETRQSLIDGSLTSRLGLNNALASYGFGLTMNMFGMPFHFDWSKLTDFAVSLEDMKFDFWIGYDF